MIDIAGLKISNITKRELLEQVRERVAKKQKTFVTTPYSEFLYASMRNPEVREMLNKSDFAIPDGIGILWAHLFLSRPFSFKNFYLKIIQSWFQVVWTGASIIFKPSLLYREIPEKIVGADLIWDLCAMAERENFSVFLLGGFGHTTEIAKQKLLQKFPKLQIAGTSNKNPKDVEVLDQINSVKPDLLFVAFGPIKQEKWIAENLQNISASFAIGLGGTFDYIAGTKKAPPKFIRRIGLEWLYRLVTQPSRLARIYKAVVGLIISLMRHKVFSSMPFRKNVIAVVLNDEGKIFIAQRNPRDPYLVKTAGGIMLEKYANYWQFARGEAEKNETLEETGRRELMEETGITSVELKKISKQTSSYLWNNSLRPLFGNIYKKKGQNQNIVYFNFVGEDSEIKLDQRELVNYKWVKMSDLDSTLHPEQADVIRIIKEDLGVENQA